MKKTLRSMLAVGCTLLLAFSAGACSKEVNAYDIAVKNGFVGTEEEWLRSLHGADGADGKDMDAKAVYEAMVAEGYTGSFLDFCKELGITVTQTNDTEQIAENVTSVVRVCCGYAGNGKYESSVGSGVIVNLNKQGGNAYIITNYHVVYSHRGSSGSIIDNIWVYLYGALDDFNPQKGSEDGNGIRATYVGGAMDYDIAVLKVEGSELLQNSVATEAKFGDSESVQLGEETFVIGNPAGAGIAVTNGVLSVASEYIGITALDNRDKNADGEVDVVSYRVMRTSAAINGGNSGGGLFNTSGELIGIVNAKSTGSATDNMGYALPINQVKAVYENILANGSWVKRATLGITTLLESSKAELDENGNVSIVDKFKVTEVPQFVEINNRKVLSAAWGKLSVGDILLSGTLNGEKQVFTRQYQITDFLLEVRKNQTVTFEVRNTSGAVESVSITFSEQHFTIFS